MTARWLGGVINSLIKLKQSTCRAKESQIQMRKETWLSGSGVGGSFYSESYLRAVHLRGDLCKGTHLLVNLTAVCRLNCKGVARTVRGLWQ